MFASLFPRLTAGPKRGQALFDAVVGEARQAHWFREGGAEDSLDGRFAVLAGVAAILLVRLESAGAAGDAASVAVTERLVEALDSELRQMGLGDPGLGKQVRSLVGLLAKRVDQARAAAANGQWRDFAAAAMLRGTPAGPEALAHTTAACADFARRLAATDDAALIEGVFA